MQQMYIIRHGQSIANASRILAGQQESPLSELGQKQAIEAGKAAADYDFDVIISSPLIRALQTAEIIAEHIGFDKNLIVTIPDLIERSFGDIEGKKYEDTPFGSGNTIETEKAPGIEPLEHFYERAKRALETLYEVPGQRILVVCHNGTGRMLMTAHAGEQPIDFYTHPRLENAVIYPL